MTHAVEPHETITRIAPPQRHYTLLTAADGRYVGVSEGATKTFDYVDDHAIWEPGDGGAYRHATSAFLLPAAEAASLTRSTRSRGSPFRLPSGVPGKRLGVSAGHSRRRPRWKPWRRWPAPGASRIEKPRLAHARLGAGCGCRAHCRRAGVAVADPRIPANRPDTPRPTRPAWRCST